MTSTHTKALNKAYSKSIKALCKTYATHHDAGLLMFVEWLKHKRDINFIATGDATCITAVHSAIAEFDAYKTSKEPEQKSRHLAAFFEILKLNMEDILANNDSV